MHRARSPSRRLRRRGRQRPPPHQRPDPLLSRKRTIGGRFFTRMPVRVAAILMLAGMVTGACAETAPPPQSILDRGPRVPSDEGVVTAVTFEQITLESARTYKISKALESFTTRERKTTPLVHWQDRYVHLGLDKEKIVVWVAGIGVVPKGVSDPRVLYAGVFEKIDPKGRAVFADGTVLRMAAGVVPPEPGKEALVTIDPVAKQIVQINSR